ncbi:MAG: rhodanese-like domain-containing protein [Gammaproteobacteria bacterium]|nr:rhodanese-like domain-containing protein [Gammaproteobacteria bacterium]
MNATDTVNGILSVRMPRFILVSAMLMLLTACGEQPLPGGVVQAIAPAQLAAQLAEGRTPLILDVRTPEEYAAGHIPEAINISHDQLRYRLAELAPSRARAVVVICESGRRARTAQAALLEAGFEDIYDLTGHMSGWREAQLPLRQLTPL